jgi:sphingolipid delta-4 desaturase
MLVALAIQAALFGSFFFFAKSAKLGRFEEDENKKSKLLSTMPPAAPLTVEKEKEKEKAGKLAVPTASSTSMTGGVVTRAVSADGKYQTDFSWTETDEPHATRRKLILAKYPEVRQLFGREIRTFYITMGIFCLQLLMCYVVRDLPWYFILPLAYVIGGTCNHALLMVGHELSHNLCFESVEHNQILSIFGNFATGVPSAITFKRYHMEHHQYQGVDLWDTDVPTRAEGRAVGNNPVLKFIWLFLQFAFYALRPPLVKPKPLGKWELINICAQVCFNAFIVNFFGYRAMAYLVGGTLLAVGVHPSGGHFIAEHYEFVKGIETYSYYGPMNFFNLNVGYHNEHHDFPKIPWSNLPKLREIAPDFYGNLPHHTSYLRVMYDYVMDPSLGPFSRVKRKLPKNMGASSSDGVISSDVADSREKTVKVQ